jgi:N-acetyl-gamma-glutamyl-phosphate reductase
MVNVAILGATGYTALELIKILLRNPQVRITALTTRQDGVPPIHTIHPSLYGRLDVTCEDLTPGEVCKRAEFVFCCLPHVASMEAVPTLLAGGCRVVDLSADYRLNDPAVYEKWYGHAHTDPARLGKTVYGLPELWAERIPDQKLIANRRQTDHGVPLRPTLCTYQGGDLLDVPLPRPGEHRQSNTDL